MIPLSSASSEIHYREYLTSYKLYDCGEPIETYKNDERSTVETDMIETFAAEFAVISLRQKAYS